MNLKIRVLFLLFLLSYFMKWSGENKDQPRQRLMIGSLYGFIVWFVLAKLNSPSPKQVTLNKREVWGKSSGRASDDPLPFKIPYDGEAVADFRIRLRNSRFFDDVEGATGYGMSVKEARELVEDLQNFNWRERVEELNNLPMFTVVVQGLNIHYVHLRANIPRETSLPSSGPVRPLDPLADTAVLMLHGWPTSFLEFEHLIQELGSARSFDVVIPSLPGFGFSEAACRPGMSCIEIGAVMASLMERLGYRHYMVLGTDWGSQIADVLGAGDGEACRGVLTNFYPVLQPSLGALLVLKLRSWTGGTESAKVFPLFKTAVKFLEMMGYLHVQGTRPHELGFALQDSAVGMAVWIGAKFKEWSDVDGPGVPRKNLLSTLYLYWMTATVTSSMRIYQECFHSPAYYAFFQGGYVDYPVGLTDFPGEVFPTAYRVARDRYKNIIMHNVHKAGGHFPATEVPATVKDDLMTFRKALAALAAN